MSALSLSMPLSMSALVVAVIGALSAPAGAQIQVTQAGGTWSVRVPLKGDPKAPEVRAAPGEITVEVPDGKVERGTAAVLGQGAAGEGLREVSASTSRSRRRAQITLRLPDGKVVPEEAVEARIEDGAILVRLRLKAAAAPIAAAAPTATATPAPATAAAPAAMRVPESAGVARRLAPALGLLSILGLGGVAALLLRRRRPGDVRPAEINILATRMLGKNQRLMVVDVSERRFLLSASDQGGVRLLARIGGPARDARDAAPEIIPEQTADSLEGVFADMISQVTPTAPAPASVKKPELKLVPPQEPEAEPAPPPTPAPAPAPVEAAAQVPAPAPVGKKGKGDQQIESADVAGLLALRRHRQGGAAR